jgi:hypothetical protein
MKTFTQRLQMAALAAALACGGSALADPPRGGPGRESREGQEYSRGHERMERRGEYPGERRREHRGWAGGFWRVAPLPFVALPRLLLPPPPPPFRLPPPPPPVVVLPRPPTFIDVFGPPAPPPPPFPGCGGTVRVIVGPRPPAW